MDNVVINITQVVPEVEVNICDPCGGGGGGGGSVDSVTGTTDRIVITGTATDPIVNIASAYDAAITAEIAAEIAAASLPVNPIISGQWRGVLAVGNQTAGTWGTGSIWYIPYYVEKAHTVTAIRAHVTVGLAASSIRLALYRPTTAYIPVTLIEGSGALPTDSAGIITYTFGTPRALTVGLYWMAIQVSSSTTLAIRNFTNGIAGFFPRASDQPFALCRLTQAYGAFPADGSPNTFITGSAGNSPMIEMLVQ